MLADAQIDADFEMTIEERKESARREAYAKGTDPRFATYYHDHRDHILERQRKWCQENKEHMREYYKKYYEEHKEEIRARERERRKAKYWSDPETERQKARERKRLTAAENTARSAEWRKNNPDRYRQKQREYYYRNHEKILEYHRKYYAEHRDEILENARKARDRKNGVVKSE